MKHVLIHTDGGCHGNPGPGGWAAVLVYGIRTRELSGGELATTNNRMELKAAIEALTALREPCRVELHTDSEYLRNGITSWLPRWKANGWRTRERKPVKNEPLWRALDAAAARHAIAWHWVKAHAGHAANERCDELARAEIEQIKRTHSPAQLQQALSEFAAREKAATAQEALF